MRGGGTGAVARLVAGDARADLGAERVARRGEQLADVAMRDLGRALLEGSVDEAAVPAGEGGAKWRRGAERGGAGWNGGRSGKMYGATGCRHAARHRAERCLLGFRPAALRQGPHSRDNERSRATGRAAYALRHGSERVSGSKPEEMSLMIVFSIDFMSHRLRGERSSGSREGARGEGGSSR